MGRGGKPTVETPCVENNTGKKKNHLNKYFSTSLINLHFV
jgi:hypothetical protein